MDFTEMTGMPKGKRTRRGRGKGKVAPNTHLANVTTALKSGDHATAKKHALSLVNALHRGTSHDQIDEVDVPGMAEEPDPPQQAAPSSGLARLASVLKHRKA